MPAQACPSRSLRRAQIRSEDSLSTLNPQLPPRPRGLDGDDEDVVPVHSPPPRLCASAGALLPHISKKQNPLQLNGEGLSLFVFSQLSALNPKLPHSRLPTTKLIPSRQRQTNPSNRTTGFGHGGWHRPDVEDNRIRAFGVGVRTRGGVEPK